MAATTDRSVFTDDDLKATLDGRIRQLEGEREGNIIAEAEAEADPHDDTSAESHARNIESLTARLTVVRERRAALGK